MRPQRRQPLRRAASALSATALAVGLLGASPTISTAQSVMPDLGAPDQSQPAQPAQPGTDVQALPPIGPDTTVPPAPMPADATPPATFGRTAVPTDQDQSHWDHRPSADRPQVAKSGRQWHPTEKPNRTITPGQMRSDREQLPEGFTKADADKAETMEAQLGTPTTDGGTFRAAAAPGCQVYWPAPYEVCGAIRDKYNALGGPSSFLLFPKTNELTNPDGKGKRTEFQNGPIYWSAQGGAHPVVNHFLAAWARRGYEAGVIGYPTTDEIVNPDGVGRRQQFTGSTIYWRLNGAYSIGGAIADKWYATGAERADGLLGYPTTDEMTLPDGIGKLNSFERGFIYWHPTTGAHVVRGAVAFAWATTGYERGVYGYPVGEETHSPTGVLQQQFKGKLFDLNEIVASKATVAFNGKQVNSIAFDWAQKQAQAMGVDFGSVYQSGPQKYSDDGSDFIPVPASYVYNPDMEPKARHDYCTSSPDDFHTPGKNANFRGPCARHDMCYDEADAHGYPYGPCNAGLRDDMMSVCREVYAVYDPRLWTCYDTADIYWSAVTVAHAGQN